MAQAAALTAQYQAALGALCQRYETIHAEGSAEIAQARHRCRSRGSRRVAIHLLCVACGSGSKSQEDALGARSVRHAECTTELMQVALWACCSTVVGKGAGIPAGGSESRTEAGHRQQVQAGTAAHLPRFLCVCAVMT